MTKGDDTTGRKPSARPRKRAVGATAVTTPAPASPASDTHAQELERLSLQYMDRIRAIEYARFELERKLELERQKQLDLISDHQQQVTDLAGRFDQLTLMLAQAERENTTALREEFQRHEKAEAQLHQQLMLTRAEVASSSGATRQLERQLTQLRDEGEAALAQLREAQSQLAEQRALVRERDGQVADGQAAVAALQDRLRELDESRAVLRERDATIQQLQSRAEALDKRVREQELRCAEQAGTLLARDEVIARSLEQVDAAKRAAEGLAARLEAMAKVVGQREEALRVAEEARGRLERQVEAAGNEGSALRGELATLRGQMLATRAELAGSRQSLVASEYRHGQLEDSISFRLGSSLIAAVTSWRGMARLPGRLWRLGKAAYARRGLTGARDEHSELLKQHLLEALRLETDQGVDLAERYLQVNVASAHERAHALTALAKHVLPKSPEDAFRLGLAAHEADPRDYRTKWLAFLHFDAGDIRRAAALLDALPPKYRFRPSERHKANQVRGYARLLEQFPDPGAIAPGPAHPPVPGRILYVAASALPFHTSGYTLRTQALVSALTDAGVDLTCVTRPGYPGDRADALVAAGSDTWREGDVAYRSIAAPDRRRCPADAYINEAADALCRLAEDVRPALVHAASNHENALPALIAARRLGLPFVYEVRGLWEVTAAARQPGWEGSERFELESRLETLVACHADLVLTLNSGMVEELVRRGVPRGRIALAPNAVDPERHCPRPRDAALAQRLGLGDGTFVVGYAGSLAGYEGIDDLLQAAALLASEHPGLRLLIVGDGEQRGALEALAAALGIADRVRFTGRIPPAEIPAHLALCDCIALPRKPATVCELVSPIKPLEAMAMGLPVIVSAVRPLLDVVDHGVTGLTHQPGDPASLASAISQLVQSPEFRRRLGAAARERVLEGNTWQSVAADVATHYRGLLPELAAGPAPVAAVEAIDLPAGRNAMTADEKEAFSKALKSACERGGVAGVRKLLKAQTRGRNGRFHAFCAIKAAGCCLSEGAVDGAVSLVEEAMAHNQEASTLKGAAIVFFNAGDDARALAVVERLEAMRSAPEDSMQHFAEQVRSRQRLFEEARRRRPRGELVPEPRRSVNFLHFSLPYASVGYATRSHGIALGVKAAGWDIRPYTRPGFPADFKPELADQALPERDEIDGLVYGRMLEGGRRGTSEPAYLLAAADRCEEVLRRERPAIVHAASNYGTALPALVAARRLGLPFIYEIRGFWEVTRSSRDGAFEKSNKYRAMQLLESLVVEEADHVITITSAMKEELVARGVDAGRITLAYNSVDPSRFRPIEPDRELAARLGIPEGVPVIGYIGSFVDYEGLDDLVRAAAVLKREGVDFRLLLVGDGAVRADLEALVGTEDVSDRVIATGRVPHEEVESYYSLVDIAPFPRKPWQVCELVSPLKPFEAMAMEKPIVVSATRALLEIVQDGYNGLVFEKGSAESLAVALRRLIEDPALRRDIGRNGRQWVEEFRSWDRAGRDVVSAYERVAATG